MSRNWSINTLKRTPCQQTRRLIKGSDQNTTILYEHVPSNDKTPEFYINQDKNSLHWSTTKVLKKD